MNPEKAKTSSTACRTASVSPGTAISPERRRPPLGNLHRRHGHTRENRNGRYREVDGGGDDERGADSVRRDQVEAREERACNRANRVGGVEQAHALAEIAGARVGRLHDEWQGRAHQDGRHDQHDERNQETREGDRGQSLGQRRVERRVEILERCRARTASPGPRPRSRLPRRRTRRADVAGDRRHGRQTGSRSRART